jgi:hypothetical protein
LHERAHERVHLVKQRSLHFLWHLLEHLLHDAAGIRVRGESLEVPHERFRQRFWWVDRDETLSVSPTQPDSHLAQRT